MSRFGFIHEDSRIVRAIGLIQNKIQAILDNPPAAAPPWSLILNTNGICSTTSDTPVVMTGAGGDVKIEAIPAGTYLFTLSGDIYSTAEAPASISVGLGINGNLLSDSVRVISCAKPVDDSSVTSGAFATQYILTVTVDDAVSAMWFVSVGGNADCGRRQLNALQVREVY